MNETIIINQVLAEIQEIISIEGEIEKIYRYGNSLIIKFKNGNKYRQPLISKYTPDIATLD